MRAEGPAAGSASLKRPEYIMRKLFQEKYLISSASVELAKQRRTLECVPRPKAPTLTGTEWLTEDDHGVYLLVLRKVYL